MKNSAIAALCKKRASLYIAPESEGEGVIQYIGCGAAAYAIDGMPRLTKDSVIALFDIPEEKRLGFNLVEFDIHKFILTGAEEFPVTENEVRIVYMGEEYAVYHIDLHSSSGSICVNTKYLKPLSAEPLNEFFARDDGRGHWQIVVKRGIEIRAIICITKNLLDEHVLDAITSIGYGLKKAAELEGKTDYTEEDPMDGQQSLFGDHESEDDGEGEEDSDNA